MRDGNEQLEELHAACVRSLKNYMVEANRTCKLLIGITEFPISIEKRSDIVTQRVIENEAHDLYQDARRDLFKAAGWSSESLDAPG